MQEYLIPARIIDTILIEVVLSPWGSTKFQDFPQETSRSLELFQIQYAQHKTRYTQHHYEEYHKRKAWHSLHLQQIWARSVHYQLLFNQEPEVRTWNTVKLRPCSQGPRSHILMTEKILKFWLKEIFFGLWKTLGFVSFISSNQQWPTT